MARNEALPAQIAALVAVAIVLITIIRVLDIPYFKSLHSADNSTENLTQHVKTFKID
ncbi:MAG: hypothetical protein WB588_07690 [Dehalococcoidia bacterium]